VPHVNYNEREVVSCKGGGKGKGGRGDGKGRVETRRVAGATT